ncbi:hypothetical protein HGA34_01960 [Candidatus Falkowbacteria bacterium]|nr:hypothetical protein [Candidatus Falkowbacteria bacterium]
MNNQHHKLIIFALGASAIAFGYAAHAAELLILRVAGRILLQVESHGEAWYVNPLDQKRSYLGRPTDALATMKRLGVGVTNADLFHIPVGLIAVNGKDGDGDKLNDDLEEALGTNALDLDTDKDGFSDKVEIEKQFNPLGWGKLSVNSSLIERVRGKILLQVESKGQAWYINPVDKKRYYLGSPTTALAVMRQLGLGISNANLETITIDYSYLTIATHTSTSTSDTIMAEAAEAIRTNNLGKTLSYFTPSMQSQISYTMGFLKNDGLLSFANMLSGARITSESAMQKIYSTDVYFSLGGYKVTINFYLDKQPDGKWLISKI